MMSEWDLAETNPSEQFAKLHFFSIKLSQATGEVEFRITVREHANPQQRGMHFFAESDKQTNQATAPFTPCGWGPTLGEAVSRCIDEIRRFPYEGPM